MIPNRTIIGNRGSGKSVSLEVMMTEVMEEASVLLVDWPGTLCDRMAGRLWEVGREDTCVLDQARRTDRVPQWRFLPEPGLGDDLTRRTQRQTAIESLLSACFGRRYQKDGTLSPNTHRAAYHALAVYQGIPSEVRPPIDHVAHLFRQRDPLGAWLLRATADREAAAFFAEAARLGRRSPQQWEYLVGGGERLLEVLISPVVAVRDGASLDWKQFLRDRRHFLLSLEGIAQTVASSLAVLAYSAAIQAAKELFEETGRPCPLVVVLEEAGALGLVTPVILTAMQALRKHGVSVWVASQTVWDFGEDGVFESLLSMSDHYWHQCASGVERAARDLSAPTYDQDKVIHRRERPMVARYREVETRTLHLNPDGWLRGISLTTAVRPVSRVLTEDVFDTPANHEAVIRHLLATLGVGERAVRLPNGTVRFERVEMPAHPFGPFADEEITLHGKTQSLARHRMDALHDSLCTSPLYQPPSVWTLPSPLPSAPTPTPGPATAGVQSAMRGS